jgi:hypothetical protein
VRGVLHDLVESGMVFQSGRGARTAYRAASTDELNLPDAADAVAARTNLVWVAVNRLGPAMASEVREMVPMSADALQGALDALLVEGKIRVDDSAATDGTGTRYLAQGCVIAGGSGGGWEAALFDHYQAVVTAICTKLRLGGSAEASEHIGGSTYSYFVWPGHPLEQEVLGLLRRLRTEAASLRQRVDAFNEQTDRKREDMTRVIAYVGQTLVEQETEGED